MRRWPCWTRRTGRLAGWPSSPAFAPYQVGKADVDGFRSAAKSGDGAVVSLTSWASMAVARTVGSWLREQSPDPAGQP